jgi:nucleotide-binding universal stress UspA family protein
VATVGAEIPDAPDAVAAIAAAVASHAADLVVMGTHGHGGLQHAFLGSVAERTIRSVERPVLAVKEDAAKAAEPIGRILLAVDFSAHSDRAAEVAGALARRLGARVDVVHAVDLPRDFLPFASDFTMEFERRIEAGAGEGLERVRERLAPSGVPVTLHVRRGPPSQVIAGLASELGSQLIALGTRGQGGLAHVLLGSVAERTLRAAPCSVLVVKAGSSRAR